MRVAVVYASADGSTEEMADRIAQGLRERGHEAQVLPARSAKGIDGFEAVVLGSAVHARQWLEDATTFVSAHSEMLRHRPLWTFSVGMPDALPRMFRNMARTEETAIIGALGDLQPCGHQLFSGVVRPSQFPLASRMFLRLVGGRYGDFRDWPSIDRWTGEIADRLDALTDRRSRVTPSSDVDSPRAEHR